MSDEDQPPASAALEKLRARINELDEKLVALLNERARVVVEVGKEKQLAGSAVYTPHREVEVLRRALEANAGPLPDRTVEAVFRELMSGSFALERPPRIGYLGPEGSRDHAVARSHFGSSVTYENLRAVDGVFTEVARRHVDYGVVPIENMDQGSVDATLHALATAPEDVHVYAEIVASRRYHLLGNCTPSEVRTVFASPGAFARCRDWLATQYPDVNKTLAPSGPDAVVAARRALERNPGAGAAAIATALAGEVHGLPVLFEEIEDDSGDVTRFLVLCAEQARPTGDDKTAVMVTVEHQSGALARVLSVFGDAGVNLTHLVRRPGARPGRVGTAGETFFLELLGHRDDGPVRQALDALEAGDGGGQLRVLGSYPRARRVL